jgi:hypothetical protein
MQIEEIKKHMNFAGICFCMNSRKETEKQEKKMRLELIKPNTT